MQSTLCADVIALPYGNWDTGKNGANKKKISKSSATAFTVSKHFFAFDPGFLYLLPASTKLCQAKWLASNNIEPQTLQLLAVHMPNIFP